MADFTRRVSYYYITVPDKPGESFRVLGALRKAGVNLLAYSAFPFGRGRSQVDLVPEEPEALTAAAKKAGLKLSARKRAFLTQGDDRIGACADLAQKLADAKINITAVDAVSAAGGRYGLILWVKAADYNRAAKALGAV